MKESTGELSMVVITLIIVIAVIAMWGPIQNILGKWTQNIFTKKTGTLTVEVYNFEEA